MDVHLLFESEDNDKRRGIAYNQATIEEIAVALQVQLPISNVNDTARWGAYVNDNLYPCLVRPKCGVLLRTVV